MSFFSDLCNRKEAIFFQLPTSITKIEDSKIRTIFRDEENGVLWDVVKSIFELDLRASYQPILMKELEIYARGEFEHTFWNDRPALTAETTEDPFVRKEPRTADKRWTPIINAEVIQLNGRPALYILRRLRYEPGSEFITQHLLIPTSRGTYEINNYAVAQATGWRESALMVVLMDQNKGKDIDQILPTIDQHYYDDPAKDEHFPEHPLSRLRNTYRWLLDRNGGNLTISADLPIYSEGEIKLDDAGCAFTLPPGYLYCPMISRRMGSIEVYTRVIASMTCHGDGKKMLGVWRPLDQPLTGANAYAEMKNFAVKSTQDWSKEGVTDIKIETKELPDYNGLKQLCCQIDFVVAKQSTLTIARWILDQRGYVFRFDISVPPFFSPEDLQAELDQIISSWRALPITPMPSVDKSAGEKPWWKFW